ncbi:MAG: rhomboid family intramembrane serine protease [Vicinamibacterales bacterium]|nr:rhomboid family intramembrane serine protease [Vicinamibacterales bacterium]
MRRYPSGVSYSFGPGGISPAVKALIIVNVVLFVGIALVPSLTIPLGLTPSAVFGDLWVWQPLTYMFLHRDLFHLLFNMLALWMFGTELERLWGTHRFAKYYGITGAGAAVTTLIVSLLPFDFAGPLYYSITIGASGAIYGLLLAWAIHFPHRPILMFLLFPVPARVFVLIMGAISLWLSITASGGGVAHVTHLGGMVFGYLYLISGRGGLSAEIKYRYLKWKMARTRRRFEVVPGGRRPGDRPGGWNDRVH